MKTIIQLLLLIPILLSCNKLSKENFKKVSPRSSGVQFNNILFENDTLNYTIFPYMYMGGGVSVGDINNDDLPDIFFTGNLVPNKLYLNKGNMQFEDISSSAGIEGNNQWFTGSTMADVNNDGWLDIYVCVSAKYQPSENLLYINNKDNTFTESGAEYGIDDKSSSIQATFFDYNNDDYLDLFVANYPIVLVSMGAGFYNDKMKENLYEESGHLYKNNGDGTFTCVTKEAGVQNFGMSIGIVSQDFNNDGWKDLYISNDFNVPDYFYLNNGDGTFREIVKDATFQTSIFGMGFDAADFNNDGLIDLFQLDMTPEDHYRATVNVIPMSQNSFDHSIEIGFHYQYMINALQLNNAIFNDTPIYSNIALMAGVAYTDWSWGGLFFDMDNDGNKDLFVTNGVLKDINNRDILNDSRRNIYFREIKEYRPELFPSTPVKNYVFRNNGDLTFSNKADEWGFDEPTLSNGMSYADFDNDGDLDLVISNINTVADIFENKAEGGNSNHIKIKLKGPETNPFGLGTIVTIETENTIQKQELTLSRGYQSSVPAVIHFGTGDYETIDQLKVIWPDRKQQVLTNVNTNQTLELAYKDAIFNEKTESVPESRFKDISNEVGVNFIHKEDKFNDFEQENLLPHKNSQMGPALAVGDINSDGLDDFFIGNAAGLPGTMYVQTDNSTFIEIPGPWIADSTYEDTGALLFDADNDGQLDLYIVSGGNDKNEKNLYKDRLYLNSENGFIKSEASLPPDLYQSGKCVKDSDFDNDGDLDLFVGGRIVPGKYPRPANSLILRNNGKTGVNLKFEDATNELAPMFDELGLVTDAVWNDFDSDGDQDLIVVGEWMNICFFQNSLNGFIDVTDQLGFSKTAGWWYSILNTDVDMDGDQDFILGNLGLNFRYQSSEAEPFGIYSNDYDVNGELDIVLSHNEKGTNYPVKGLDASSRQLPVLRMRFEGYEHFGRTTLEEIYGEQMLAASLHYEINTFAHCWIENTGQGKYQMHQLPNMAQISSINDIVQVDNEAEGSAFIVAGNLYGTEVESPRADASIGLVLMANTEGNITAVPPVESNLVVKGEVKAIEKIKLASGNQAYIFAINNDSPKIIEYRKDH